MRSQQFGSTHLSKAPLLETSYQKKTIRLTSGLSCAIKRRSAESEPSVTKLQHNIRNSINHVMGHHSQCSADFCKVRQNMTASVTNTESTTTVTHAGTSPPPSATSCEETEQPSSVNNIDSAINATLEDQSFYWLEGSSEAEEEEARGECPDGQLPLSADLHQDVLAILERMAKKANRLLGNFTTNLAECWLSVRCKFDGGKNVFRCRRGSWNARVYGAGLRQLMGHNWSPIT